MTVDTEKNLFTLHQIGLSYRARPVLRGINWEWNTGDHWALLGPNGAGKTALATILAGEQTHYSGRFERGEALRAGTAPHASGVAYVCFERGRRLCERDSKLDCSEFESDARDAGTRVRELLQAETDDEAELQAVIDLLSLQRVLDRGLRYISTGELRKVLLASALLSRPRLLILDSPMDGLDHATQALLNNALDDIIATSPAVLVLGRSTSEVPEACNRLMLLDRGRIAAMGDTRDVLASPSTAAVLEAPALRFGAPPALVDRQDGDTDSATIELEDVSVAFGDVQVFRNVNWRLDSQQHCHIVGPNGCGKTTLLDLLTGDNHKAYGQKVSLFGRRRGSGESVWDIKARFGRVDARIQYAIPSGSSVVDVVVSGFFDSLGLRDVSCDAQRRTAREWIAALGLADYGADEFATLSFGMQRLALLARAMVKSPRILLLDEATLSLDAGHRRLLMSAIDHAVASSGCQLLFVSHTAGEVPACINQRLEFLPSPEGSEVVVSNHGASTG